METWIFGYLEMWICGVYIDIETYMNTYQPFTAVSQLLAALRFPEKNYLPAICKCKAIARQPLASVKSKVVRHTLEL